MSQETENGESPPSPSNTAEQQDSAAGGNSGQPSGTGESPYPAWYDPSKEPSENEPGLPLERDEEPADSETTKAGAAGTGTTETETTGTETAGTRTAEPGTAPETTASLGGGAETALTPEEWDAVWGAPEG